LPVSGLVFLDKRYSLIIIISMITTTVTGKNQITIPAKLARQLDIQQGTQIVWSIGAEGVLIAQPLPRRSALARETAGIGRQWLPENADPVGDLIRERAGEDEEEGIA
jgi:AbrB family looped-hinge helix DNA binding protein